MKLEKTEELRASNEPFRLECVRLLSDGAGSGYTKEGITTFVPGLLPGETGVIIRRTEAKKKFQRGQLLEVIQHSSDRALPPCPVYEECGGCQLQHMTYEATLAWKQRWVEDALLRIGKIKAEVKPTIGMSDPWRYRNKARLHWNQQGRLGYFKEKSKALVHFQDCLLLSERMNRWIRQTEKFLQVLRVNDLNAITFRENTRGEGLLLAEGGSLAELSGKLKNNPAFMDTLGREGVRSLWWTDAQDRLELVWGEGLFRNTILGVDFILSPLSFLQVNSLQTEVLYNLAISAAQLTGMETVWDLYTGIGTLALCMAPKAKRVLGIEENPYAIKDAKKTLAERSDFGNAEFLVGKVEDLVIGREDRPDVVVVDPPRAGMHLDVVKKLLEVRSERIVYVSCDPGTLARDLGLLSAGGYRVESVQPVDMFPWTSHVETVVRLERKHTTK